MQELNMCGKQCPIPVIETKRFLEQAIHGDTVSVLVDNEIAVLNLLRLAKSRHDEAEVKKMPDDNFKVEIRVASASPSGSAPLETGQEEPGRPERKAAGRVVVISSDRMGEGEEELGRLLMKSFIFALSKQDALPDSVLFYNGGARLTAEDSDSREDLKMMEAEGVEILTCGLCLQYLGLEDKLRVGAVTNMYDIVERMTLAKQIIRP